MRVPRLCGGARSLEENFERPNVEPRSRSNVPTNVLLVGSAFSEGKKRNEPYVLVALRSSYQLKNFMTCREPMRGVGTPGNVAAQNPPKLGACSYG